MAVTLARLHTGATDVVTVDKSFHGGGLSFTSEISPEHFASQCRGMLIIVWMFAL